MAFYLNLKECKPEMLWCWRWEYHPKPQIWGWPEQLVWKRLQDCFTWFYGRWENSIQQEIKGKVQRKLAYDVTAVLRIFGNNVSNSDVWVTMWVQTPNFCEQYKDVAQLVLFFYFLFHIVKTGMNPHEICENCFI